MDKEQLDYLLDLLDDIDSHKIGENQLTLQDKFYIMELQDMICDVRYKIERLKALKPKLIVLKARLEDKK